MAIFFSHCNKVLYINVFFLAEIIKLFRSLAVDDRLPKGKLSTLFDKAEMHPTQREIDDAFNIAFKGYNIDLIY